MARKRMGNTELDKEDGRIRQNTNNNNVITYPIIDFNVSIL